MGRKPTPGLYQETSGIWVIDKHICGKRVHRSTGTKELSQAELFLSHVQAVTREANINGTRPRRTFEQAAIYFVESNQQKRSLKDDIGRLRVLLPFIGADDLADITMTTLQPFIQARKDAGVTIGTINHGLTLVRRILNLAATEWVDDNGLTWLAAAPKIKLLNNSTKAKPNPLSWSEQDRLFAHLPEHLTKMATFAVNTGCRDAEVCNLQWQWEFPLPQLDTSVFIVPAENVKNGNDRLVVLNSTAREVIELMRGRHTTHVFTFQENPITRMNNTAWRSARTAAGLQNVRVHDLKHTFGRRLRAAGVSFEDRQDLLGHKAKRITTHYSAAEIANLITAAETVADTPVARQRVMLLTRQPNSDLPKIPRVNGVDVRKSLLNH